MRLKLLSDCAANYNIFFFILAVAISLYPSPVRPDLSVISHIVEILIILEVVAVPYVRKKKKTRGKSGVLLYSTRVISYKKLKR